MHIVATIVDVFFLRRCGRQAFKDGLEPGTFRESLEGLRSDLINKAVQHRQLAKNLTTDVLEPLSELRGRLSTKSKVLVRRALSMVVLIAPLVIILNRRCWKMTTSSIALDLPSVVARLFV